MVLNICKSSSLGNGNATGVSGGYGVAENKQIVDVIGFVLLYQNKYNLLRQCENGKTPHHVWDIKVGYSLLS